MGVIGDILQLVFRQRFLNTDLLNVFYYQQMTVNSSPTETSPNGLMTAFMEDVAPSIAAIQVVGVTYTELECINLFDPDDLGSDTGLSLPGGTVVAADVESPWTVFEFQTNRTSRNIRRGAKRFSGVSEAWLIQGQLDPTHTALVGAVSVALSAAIQAASLPGTPLFQPVTVKRIPYVTSSGSTAYRLPENAGESVEYVATWNYTRISTQNSRKGW